MFKDSLRAAKTFFISSILIPGWLTATFFANPALPALQSDGIFFSSSWGCLRAGYMTDHLYHQRFEEEFKLSAVKNPSNFATMTTNAATITLNFKGALDLTAILGSSQLQMDQEVYGTSRFAWGAGAKLIFYRTGSIFCGLDLKYFESNQRPVYFISDGYAYNVQSFFKLNYTDMQAALGISYRTKSISPYMHLTYLHTQITPQPSLVTVRFPLYNHSIDTSSKSVISQRRWGMAVGGTILGGKKGSLTIESRFFNQNAINVSGEIRF